MFISTSNNRSVLKIAIAATIVAALVFSPCVIAEEHGQMCGAKCIKSGGPVGIVSDGKAYLVVGEHKPMNDELAEYCGKTITVKGKLAERGGIAMIENAEVVKK